MKCHRLLFSARFSLPCMLKSHLVHVCFEEHLNAARDEGRDPCHADWMKQSSGASIYFAYETYFYMIDAL